MSASKAGVLDISAARGFRGADSRAEPGTKRYHESLPHEPDYTHLRMIWRRWKKKAALKVFGHPVTPFGPRWLDSIFSKVFMLKGDYVPDSRQRFKDSGKWSV